MSNVIVSPNMSLPVPVPGVDPGPDYANNLNSSLNIVDGHNHTPGSGVLITPLGLNINTNLNFQNNDPTNVAGVDFSAPALSTVPTRLYTAPQSGGGVTDLFYNDGAGNTIPITKAGAVNVSAASIPGESYSGGTFTWKQGASSATPANFDIGLVTIRPDVSSTSYGVQLQPPAAIASQYSLVLPALPPAQQIMTLDNSGNITAPYTVDNSTITIASNVIGVPSQGITATQIANNTITTAQLAASVIALLVPSGVISAFGGTSAPTGYLICDGTSYLRSSYPTLFSAIGTAYGTADVTHFNVPDLRGQFLRGVSGVSANDPDKTSRIPSGFGGNSGNNVGSLQYYQIQSHSHTGKGLSGAGSAWLPGDSTGSNDPSTNATQSTGGSETRPLNIYVNYIIKI